MEHRRVNPWAWQDSFGYSQAIEVSGERRTLVCSGQGSVDEEGHPVHEGDMRAQVALTMDNLEAVLAEAGMGLSDVVRLNHYTTDVDAFFEAMDIIGTRMGENLPSSTLLGVTRLAYPEMMVEIEATAMA